MLKKGSHITTFFVLLISMSLSLSTVHFHESIEHQTLPDAQTEATTTLDADATYCPICGYLFSAEIQSPGQWDLIFNNTDELILPDLTRYSAPSLFWSNNRSPPFLA